VSFVGIEKQAGGVWCRDDGRAPPLLGNACRPSLDRWIRGQGRSVETVVDFASVRHRTDSVFLDAAADISERLLLF
jgi:hypothetical protein